MKYYSEILNKLFTTEDELNEAEEVHKERVARERKEREEKTANEKIRLQEVRDAYQKYEDLALKFDEDYGYAPWLRLFWQ